MATKRHRRTTGMVKGEEELTDQQLEFCAQYLVDFNASRAARAVGVKASSAPVMGVKWLSNPKVKAAIGEIRKERLSSLQLQAEEFFEELFYLCTRRANEFVDESGKLLPIHEMGDRARACIDGIKQHVRVREDGEDVDTEIKLVSKAKALELAAEVMGLKRPKQEGGGMGIDFAMLVELLRGGDKDDEIERRLLELEAIDAESQEQ